MKRFCCITTLVLMTIAIGILFSGCFGFGGTASEPTGTPDPNATPVPEKDVNVDFVVYEGESFSIEYNKTWGIKENLLSQDGNTYVSEVTLTTPDGINQGNGENSYGRVYPTVSIVKNNAEEGFDLVKYTEDAIQYLREQLYSFTVIKSAGEPDYKEIDLNGEKAFSFEYAGSLISSGEIKARQIITEKNGQVFILTYIAEPEFFNDLQYAEIAEKTLMSFKFR